jgi:hypothetical protein
MWRMIRSSKSVSRNPLINQFRPYRFQEDWNVVFPLDRLNELAAEGTIGSVAATHYSFMGATDPVQRSPMPASWPAG